MPDLLTRVRLAFASTTIDTDIVEELAQHAESKYEELRADGVSESEALARIDQLIDGWRRDPHSLRREVKRRPSITPPVPSSMAWTSGAWADVIYGARMLRAKPGYAAITILTIALGVGAVTTLFSVASSVLMRPLSWASGDGLVRVIESRGGREGRVPGTMMNGSYLAWAEAPQTIEAIGGFTEGALTLTGAGDAVRIPVTNVSPSLLPLLGAQPLRGRLFEGNEGRDNNWRFVLLSEGLWEQRFGRRDDIVGRQISLDNFAATVVGVMPRSFRFPTSETQMWLPFTVTEVDGPNNVKRGQIFRALARLKPGVSIAQANAEGTARAVSAPDAGPVAMSLFGTKEPIQLRVVDANDAATAEVRPAIVILFIAAGLLFVTAVANVANMQLARAAARIRELTIRAALGAGTSRLSRQLLIENAIVGVSGAATGLLLTFVLHRFMKALLPAGFPRADEIAIDARVLAFAVIVAAVTSVAAGALPLLQARRLDLVRTLADGAHGSVGAGRGPLTTMRLLIASSQVAMTSILIIGALLLSRSLAARMSADRGFDASNLLTASVPFPGGYTFEQRQQARTRILDRLKQRPGITHAAFSTGLPLMSAGGFTSFNFNSPLRNGVEIQAEAIRRVVTPDYFGALGIRIRAGRALADTDVIGSPTAVVVNRSFVRKFLEDIPSEQAIGLTIGTAAVRGTTYKGDAVIVGVSDDMRQDAVEAPEQPELFSSVLQMTETSIGTTAIIVVRTIDDPATYVEALRTVMREEDPRIALDAVMTMEQRVGESLSRPRIYAVLFGGFAAFALVIAGAGLFGVLSHSVTQRARELAVRTALGATRGEVIVVALRQMALAMAAGVAIGVAAAVALSRNLAPFVYGIPVRDWISFGVAPIVLLVAGAIACIVPAVRVAKSDPLTILREP